MGISVTLISVILKANVFAIVLSLCLTWGLVQPAWAGNQDPGLLEATKKILQGNADDEAAQWITEKTGQFLSLDVMFVDENGSTIRLGDIIDRPTIILPIYFYCPNICSKNLANLAVAMNSLSAKPGLDYRVIALSFNELETPQEASEAKRNYLKILADDFPAGEWRFLTGSNEAIKIITAELGFRFKKVDDETFIHPAALMAIAADGKIIRYVYGSFLAGDIDLALSAAASGTPTMSVRRLLGFCFNYDPHGKNSLFTTVKIVVLLIFGTALVVFIWYFKRKGRKVNQSSWTDSSNKQDTTS